MPTFANDDNGNKPLYYVPLTLSANDGSGFIQQVTVNPSSYTSYLASNLSNVNFQDGNGNLLYSWQETVSATNTSTSAMYWLTLPNATTTTVYMVLVSNLSSSLSTSHTGATPQYSSTYGQYDNGANVFLFYDNFAGTSLSSKWTAAYGANTGYSVDNGITVTAYSGLTGNSSPQVYGSSTTAVNGPIEIDFYGVVDTAGKTGASNNVGAGLSMSSAFNDSSAYIGSFGYSGAAHTGLIVTDNTANDHANSSGVGVPDSSNAVYTIEYPAAMSSSTTVNAYQNYGSEETITGVAQTVNQSGTSTLGFASQSSGQTLGPIYWIRTRQYPTGGTMPTATAGSLRSVLTVTYVSPYFKYSRPSVNKRIFIM